MIYNLNDTLKFGKHSGRTLKNIICGEAMDSLLVANFLKKCFDFFSEKTQIHNLWASDYLVDKHCYNPFSKTGITLQHGLLPFKNIQVENGLIFLHGSPDIKQKLSNIIIPFLESDFEPKIIISYTKDYNLPLIPECIKVRPDHDYITWAIKNVPDFAIAKDAITTLFNCNSLRSFKVFPFVINKYRLFNIHLNFIGYKTGDTIIEYEPVFRHYEHSFSPQIIAVNNEKALRLYNIIPPTPEYKDHRGMYSKHGGAEINGTWYDDYTIDSAFEGDPNNAWNID